MRPYTIALNTIAAALSVPLALVASGGGTGYEIERSINSGGHDLTATGNGFELRGVIEVAHNANPTGNGFDLISGFWFPIAPTDCDEDGTVSLMDYGAFEFCLTGPDAPLDGGCECFDINHNGAIELADFAVSQRAFSGP